MDSSILFKQTTPWPCNNRMPAVIINGAMSWHVFQHPRSKRFMSASSARLPPGNADMRTSSCCACHEPLHPCLPEQATCSSAPARALLGVLCRCRAWCALRSKRRSGCSFRCAGFYTYASMRSAASHVNFYKCWSAGDCCDARLHRDSGAEGPDLPDSVQHVMTCLSGYFAPVPNLWVAEE